MSRDKQRSRINYQWKEGSQGTNKRINESTIKQLNSNIMDKKVSTTNTKAQILEAYDELMKKLEEKSNDNPKEVQQRNEQRKIVDSSQENTEKSILKDITGIKTSFLDSIEKVQENLLDEYKKLSTIQEAIGIEKKKLDDLYGLSSNTDSLAAILLAQKESKQKFDEEMKETKDAFDREMAELKSKWDKEKVERESQIKEETDLQKKLKKREEEEYDYGLEQKRKKEADEYKMIKLLQEKELKEKKNAFEKDFAEREKDIKEKEKEYAELKKANEDFPKEIEKSIINARTELENRLNTAFKFEKELLAKETEGIFNLKNLQIKTLENKITEIEAQLKAAGQKVDISEKSVKDIAIKAIDSSSKIQFLEKEKSEKEK